MNELKPCPFCGTQPKAEPASRAYVVLCANDPGCAVLPAVAGDTLELAARKWNARKSDPTVDVLIQTLRHQSRAFELQARVMEDPTRTGGWEGAQRVADAFWSAKDRADAALAVQP